MLLVLEGSVGEAFPATGDELVELGLGGEVCILGGVAGGWAPLHIAEELRLRGNACTDVTWKALGVTVVDICACLGRVANEKGIRRVGWIDDALFAGRVVGPEHDTVAELNILVGESGGLG